MVVSAARTLVKPPLFERVAELAMRMAHRYLADYGATLSRHDFTQRQLMSCLVLRAHGADPGAAMDLAVLSTSSARAYVERRRGKLGRN